MEYLIIEEKKAQLANKTFNLYTVRLLRLKRNNAKDNFNYTKIILDWVETKKNTRNYIHKTIYCHFKDRKVYKIENVLTK